MTRMPIDIQGQLLAALDSNIALLVETGEQEWARTLQSLRVELDSDTKSALSKLLRLFGGMGSYNDLVLFREGSLLRDETNMLDALRQQLFSLCVASRSPSGELPR